MNDKTTLPLNGLEKFDAKNYVDSGVLLVLIKHASPEQKKALLTLFDELEASTSIPEQINKPMVMSVVDAYRKEIQA